MGLLTSFKKWIFGGAEVRAVFLYVSVPGQPARVVMCEHMVSRGS